MVWPCGRRARPGMTDVPSAPALRPYALPRQGARPRFLSAWAGEPHRLPHTVASTISSSSTRDRPDPDLPRSGPPSRAGPGRGPGLRVGAMVWNRGAALRASRASELAQSPRIMTPGRLLPERSSSSRSAGHPHSGSGSGTGADIYLPPDLRDPRRRTQGFPARRAAFLTVPPEDRPATSVGGGSPLRTGPLVFDQRIRREERSAAPAVRAQAITAPEARWCGWRARQGNHDARWRSVPLYSEREISHHVIHAPVGHFYLDAICALRLQRALAEYWRLLGQPLCPPPLRASRFPRPTASAGAGPHGTVSRGARIRSPWGPYEATSVDLHPWRYGPRLSGSWSSCRTSTCWSGAEAARARRGSSSVRATMRTRSCRPGSAQVMTGSHRHPPRPQQRDYAERILDPPRLLASQRHLTIQIAAGACSGTIELDPVIVIEDAVSASRSRGQQGPRLPSPRSESLSPSWATRRIAHIPTTCSRMPSSSRTRARSSARFRVAESGTTRMCVLPHRYRRLATEALSHSSALRMAHLDTRLYAELVRPAISRRLPKDSRRHRRRHSRPGRKHFWFRRVSAAG